jgi:NAD(P)-dependent dehydrogenase (short-subunit alcohol dehydrogenase family)
LQWNLFRDSTPGLKNVVHQTVDRLGQPKDIAAAVCTLASPLSDFLTGTTFRIDGGATSTLGRRRLSWPRSG